MKTFYLFTILSTGKVFEAEIEYQEGDYCFIAKLYPTGPGGEAVTEAELPQDAAELDALIIQHGGEEFARFRKEVDEAAAEREVEISYDEALWTSLGARESYYDQSKLDYFR